MSLFSRLFGNRPTLGVAESRRLTDWQALPACDIHARLEQARFVVVDVETTGLSLNQDRLIAIGAVAVSHGRIDLADSFEVIQKQEASSTRDNILVHGIGGTAQIGGVEPAEALLRFLEFLGNDPLVAFHVTFDETMIKRAMRHYLGLDFKHAWLDLAYVMPGFLPELTHTHRSLDDWSNRFHISNFARHSALADALSTAQLFQAALHIARQKNIAKFKSLQDVEKAQRWISWSS
ncbi:MAG: 3'-5' exonuclease [Sulfuricella sp.]|nr:3'-5' exonuclease [Sulfuricella sp.]